LLALKARIQPSSWKKEVTHYELHIKPLLGNRALKSITPEDLEKILDQLKIKELSPRSKQYAIGTFFRIWKHAAKRKFVKTGDNPASGISIERVNNARLRILSSKELQDILDHLKINDPHGFELVIFCAYTGCRFSEAARLTWEYVDLNRKAILFHQTKNKDSREIYLAAGIVEVLNARGLGLTGQHVFTKKDGSSFKEPPSSFSTAVRLLELNQGRGARDRVSFHTLRHTAATIAARNKIPVKDMQHMFGWKTPAMVFLYAKGNEDIQRSAAEGIAKSLSGDNTKIISLEESLLSKKHVV
jgi:integrase